MKIDFHVHSYYSKDSLMRPEKIVETAKKKGLDGVAIVDHDRLVPRRTLRPVPGFIVIRGEEVTTSDGEIIGLGIKRWIPRGMSAEETAAAIREQGGVVVVPHPFEITRKSASEEVLESMSGYVLEVANARSLLQLYSDRPSRYAVKKGLPRCAGSDAHSYGEIGSAYTILPKCRNAGEVLSKLAKGKGRLVRGISPPYVHAFSMLARVSKKLRRA